MTEEQKDRESLESDIRRDEREKPTINIYNEEANGGRWWEKQQ